jgi:YihY family inner membrane protein
MTAKIERATSTAPIIESPPARGLSFYLRGGWLFFKRMWPAIYDLSTAEVYVFASAIAFNVLLSFFPFVVLIGSFLVNVLHWQHGYETVYRLMMAFVPVKAALLFESLDLVTRGQGSRASLISIIMLIFSSAGVFLPLEIALNRAWGFKEPRGMLKQQLTYLPLVTICGLIIIICVAQASAWDYALGGLFGPTSMRTWTFRIVGTLIALPFIALTLFLLYYWVPNGKVQGSQVFFVSVAMAVLWTMTTLVYRLAIPFLNFKGSYEGLFELMAVVIWVFISSFILILGANLSARQVLPKSWTGRLPRLSRASQSNTE